MGIILTSVPLQPSRPGKPAGPGDPCTPGTPFMPGKPGIPIFPLNNVKLLFEKNCNAKHNHKHVEVKSTYSVTFDTVRTLWAGISFLAFGS